MAFYPESDIISDENQFKPRQVIDHDYYKFTNVLSIEQKKWGLKPLQLHDSY